MYEKRGSDWGVGGLVLAALRSSPDPLTVRQIADATGRSGYSVRNNLDMLCFRSEVVRLGRGGPHTPHHYMIATDDRG